MSSFEYTVIPAPARGEKAKGAKTGIERFAATLSDTLNDMARDGWEYVRAETLPAEERTGLTSRSTVYHNLLVFRRALGTGATYADPVPVAQSVTQPAAMPSQPETGAPSATKGPFTAPMRAGGKPGPKLAEENHARARISEPPLTAPESPAPEIPAPAGPRLGPASR